MLRAIVNRRFGLRSGVHLQRYMFGGAVTPKPFDWRDDHSLNPFYEEDIEVLEMPFSDALKMIANGEIVDMKTIILIQYAQINKLLECKN